MGDQTELEEERRLCYVGMTRSRKRLYLSCAASRRIWGTLQQPRPSRFLTDIPSEFLQMCSPMPLSPLDAERSQETSSAFVGRWVRHQQFGAGQIRQIVDGGTRVVVHFPGVGDKRFLTEDAPLRWL
jgi:DNA helicase-2/ATP-dependent DNA helicase PcrA